MLALRWLGAFWGLRRLGLVRLGVLVGLVLPLGRLRQVLRRLGLLRLLLRLGLLRLLLRLLAHEQRANGVGRDGGSSPRAGWPRYL